MAEPVVPTPPTPPAVQVEWKALGAMLYQFLPTGILKTVLGIFLGIAAGWHYVKSDVVKTIEQAPKGIIEKLLPKKGKAADAIGRIQFGRYGCTATVIGPIGDGDEIVDVLTAAHCVKLGDVGRMQLKDGRTLDVKCVARDAKHDVAWLQATKPTEEIAWLELAEVPPPPGTPVWHQGYGVDQPANVERGQVSGSSKDGKDVYFELSVSSGDSGGGIICTTDNRVISPVCCTTCLGCYGSVRGGAPAAARAIRPGRTTSTSEPPMVHPVLPLPSKDWPDLAG